MWPYRVWLPKRIAVAMWICCFLLIVVCLTWQTKLVLWSCTASQQLLISSAREFKENVCTLCTIIEKKSLYLTKFHACLEKIEVNSYFLLVGCQQFFYLKLKQQLLERREFVTLISSRVFFLMFNYPASNQSNRTQRLWLDSEKKVCWGHRNQDGTQQQEGGGITFIYFLKNYC